MQARWGVGLWGKVKGAPWEPVPGREGNAAASRVAMPTVPTNVPPMREGPKWEQSWRRPNIEIKDATTYGMTPGCPRCVAANKGTTARGYTDERRKRMEGQITQAGDAMK